jgi:hypothetical protein
MCRLYLQAITLADVSSADGTYILSAAKQGIQLTGCNSSLDWPTQERPNKTAWEYQAYQLSHLETRGKLQTKLGEWVNYHCQQWDTYIDPATFSLYSKDNYASHIYIERRIATRSTNNPWYNISAMTPLSITLPPSTVPAMIQDNQTPHEVLVQANWSPVSLVPPPPPNPPIQQRASFLHTQIQQSINPETPLAEITTAASRQKLYIS